jgi:hypothetical protein
MEKALSTVLDNLYEEDESLFKLGAAEWAITFRFAAALKSKLEAPPLVVDCDYNRRGAGGKEVLRFPRRPDILLHERGGDKERNLLAIECKRAGATPLRCAEDCCKLIALQEDEDYAYKDIAFVEFGSTRERATIAFGRHKVESRLRDLGFDPDCWHELLLLCAVRRRRGAAARAAAQRLGGQLTRGTVR